jgi:hypothetical protein
MIGKDFKQNIMLRTLALMITLPSVPLCSYVLSPKGFIPLFSLEAPLFMLEFNLKVNKKTRLCYKSPCPLGTNFGIFKNHYYFVNFPSSKFIFVMFIFFDGVLVENQFEFFFIHV